MSIPGSASPLLLASTASTQYQVQRSLRFNSADSAYLSRTPASAGNRKTWTWAGWVKRANLGSRQMIFGNLDSGASLGFDVEFIANDSLDIYDYSGGFAARRTTTQVFRDCSSWYHIVIVYDSTNATAADRLCLYVNGSRVTAFANSTDPAPNADGTFNTAVATSIGRSGAYNLLYLSGYLADIHFIDGQALTPSSFTEVSATTGQLIPKAYTGSFNVGAGAVNGFWLKFSDNSAATATTLGKDYSGNSNNWTPNNLSVTAGAGNDSLVDTPTSYGTDTGAGGEVRGNYCVGNWLNQSDLDILRDGNLHWRVDNTRVVTGTHAMSSGKWYWEATVDAIVSLLEIGIVGTQVSFSAANNTAPGTYISGFAYRSNATKINNNSATSYGASFTSGDLIGVAFDANAGTITFYKNGSTQGTAFTGITSGSYVPCVYGGGGGGNTGAFFNFGQRPFTYTAPSGFKALCDTNLPSPLVAKPNTVMDAILYSGNSSTQSITSLAFSPDLVWSKCRNVVRSHRLSDAVRGSNRDLYSDVTYSEVADGSITAFTANGFNLDNSTGSQYNTSGETYVSWCWDAGTSTASNTQGSITSQVRANASAGFSVVSWTAGTAPVTIGHGLGVAPQFIIIKSRTSGAVGWQIGHVSLGWTKRLFFDTAAADTTTAAWNDTSPTSTVFTIGSTGYQTGNMIAYCFAPVTGYSSFGSYTGNGSADGPFVYTGHRSRWLMVKRSDTGLNDWYVLDTARSTYNVAINELLANSSSAENPYTGVDFDLLSNGFKIRATEGSINASGGTFIYASFAESPLQYARAR